VVFWLVLFHIIFAIIAWLVILPRVRRFAGEVNAITIPEFIGKIYSSEALRILTALIIIAIYILYLVSILKGTGEIVSTLLGINYETTLILITLPVMVYLALGDFKAIARTNFMHGLIALAGAIITSIITISFIGGLGKIMNILSTMEIKNIYKPELALSIVNGMGPPKLAGTSLVTTLVITIAFVISMAQITAPHLYYIAFTAKSEETISRAKILAPILIAIYALMVFPLGLTSWSIVQSFNVDILTLLKNPDQVVPLLIKNIIPISLAAIVVAAIIGLTLSTLDNASLLVKYSI